MATDDRDTPAGAAEGTRADMPAGAPATHADHGNPGADSGSPDYAEAAAEPFPPADARPGAGPAVPEGLAPGTPGADNDASAGPAPVEQADERPDDDFEPFLPPGPNPFSSVHPQGTPPYRPAANGGYPNEPGEPETAASLRPADPGRAASGAAAPGPDPDAGGQSPDVREPGQPGHAEHGYTPVSPYPPVPDDEPDVAGPAHGEVSPYPVYRPYGPGEDDGAGDAMTDYGLPSPQAYGFAPPPPPVEPLPDLGIPEQGYRNEPRQPYEPYESYEPPGYRDEVPGQEDREQSAASVAGRERPGSGHRRTQGPAGQHRAGAAENGVRSAGLRGPAPTPGDATGADGAWPWLSSARRRPIRRDGASGLGACEALRAGRPRCAPWAGRAPRARTAGAPAASQCAARCTGGHGAGPRRRGLSATGRGGR